LSNRKKFEKVENVPSWFTHQMACLTGLLFFMMNVIDLPQSSSFYTQGRP